MIQVQVIVPVSANQLDALEPAVLTLQRVSQVEIEILIALSAGVAGPERVHQAMRFMGDVSVPTSLLFADGASMVGYNEMVARAMGSVKTPYVLVSPVSLLLDDKEWFGKFQQPFRHDRFCGFVGAFDEIEWNTRQPNRLGQREAPLGRTFFGSTKVLQSCKVSVDPTAEDYAVAMSFAVRERGMSAWMAPAIRQMNTGKPWSRQEAARAQIGGS